MIAPAPLPNDRAPSFWMTALSLVAAGFVASFFVGLTEPTRLFASSLAVSLVYTTLMSALIGGFVLRRTLPLLTGFEISYPWAVAALGAGGLVSAALTTTVQAVTLGHSPSEAPAVWTSPIVLLVATGASFLVSYWVITIGGHTRASSPPRRLEPSLDAPTPIDLPTDLVRTQNAVTNACIDVSRARAVDIPSRVVDALSEISVCANRLREADIPDPATRSVVANLVGGLERFSEALTDIASDAAASGSDRLPQPGLLFGSLADISDGGGRARYELDHADGLAQIRAAFEALRGLGYLREDG